MSLQRARRQAPTSAECRELDPLARLFTSTLRRFRWQPASFSLFINALDQKIGQVARRGLAERLQEPASLRHECVKSASSQNLLDASATKELAIKHLFEQVSVKRELHVAGMLLRRRIARVSIAEALEWVKSDPLFVRPDPDGKLLTIREVRDAENKMIRLAAEGQGKHEPLNGGKEWVIRQPLSAPVRNIAIPRPARVVDSCVALEPIPERSARRDLSGGRSSTRNCTK
jgi:hypothetical protein